MLVDWDEQQYVYGSLFGTPSCLTSLAAAFSFGVWLPSAPDVRDELRQAASTHLYLLGMPLRRPQTILGRKSAEKKKVLPLTGEAQIRKAASPSDPFDGLQ